LTQSKGDRRDALDTTLFVEVIDRPNNFAHVGCPDRPGGHMPTKFKAKSLLLQANLNSWRKGGHRGRDQVRDRAPACGGDEEKENQPRAS
jgi:hypothetical protein